jgi:hypothetical protein
LSFALKTGLFTCFGFRFLLGFALDPGGFSFRGFLGSGCLTLCRFLGLFLCSLGFSL